MTTLAKIQQLQKFQSEIEYHRTQLRARREDGGDIVDPLSKLSNDNLIAHHERMLAVNVRAYNTLRETVAT